MYPAATPLLNVLSALFLHLLRSNMRFLVSSLSCPVAECITLNPQYKPPVGYKPVLKEARLYIPVSSSNVFSHFHVIRAFLIAPLPSPVFDMSCVCRVSRRFLASKTFRLIPLVFKWPLCRFVMRQPVNVIGSQVGCLPSLPFISSSPPLKHHLCTLPPPLVASCLAIIFCSSRMK